MLKTVSLFLALLTGLVASVSAGTVKMVGIDGYHNTANPPHYAWSETDLGGYSQFAGILLTLGADTVTLTTPFDSSTLSPLSVLVIVNPGTKNLIGAAEINAVDKWVQQGGKLMCFANNKGNVEFVHYDSLMARFGITFNDTTQTGGSNFGPVPQNEVFSNCTTFYIVDMCNLTVAAPAKSIFTFQGSVLMATALKGNGAVFATGDPWVYNEHIAAQDNIKGITQVMNWLLGNATPVLRSMAGAQREAQKRLQNGYRMVLPNGRLVSGAVSLPGSSFAPKAHGVVFIEGTSGGGQEHVPLRP
jgi:unsaturated rhamnogalacturonyl hydrolase